MLEFRNIGQALQSAMAVDAPGSIEYHERRRGRAADELFRAKKDSAIRIDVPFAEGHTQKFQLHITQADTRGPNRETNDGLPLPLIVEPCAFWGLSSEEEAFYKVMATAFEDEGAFMDTVSMPEHGWSDKLPIGWDHPQAFDQVATILIAYIEKRRQENPGVPIILNGWSMGGITSLKIAAQRPDLIDGIILYDVPMFRSQLFKTARRFIIYPLQGIVGGVKREQPFQMQTKLLGLSVFLKRWKERNRIEGMPRSVVMKTAKQICQQDLFHDGPPGKEVEGSSIRRVAQSGIPILYLQPENHSVIPQDMINRFEIYTRDSEAANLTMHQVDQAGHQLPDERPRDVGLAIRNWFDTKWAVYHRARQAAQAAQAGPPPVAVEPEPTS